MTALNIDRVDNPTLREEIFQVKLPSGLRVSFCPKPGFQKKYACYSTHYGSVDNEFTGIDGKLRHVPDGIAHFLEHTLFETEEGNVSDLFSLNGASNNAYTSYLQTTYLFSSSSRFYDNLRLLVDFVEQPAFRKDKVDKERGIIEEEIRMYDDRPDWAIHTGLLENLFGKHSIRVDIAGTAESIAEIDVETLQSCYDVFYHPSNMHLFVAGDLDRDELFDFLATRSRVRDGERGPIQRRYAQEARTVHEKSSRLEMDVAMPKLYVGYKEVGLPLSGRDFILWELASQMGLDLLFGRSSDAFLELYGEQLILDDFGAGYDGGAGIGWGAVGGDTPDPDRLEAEIHARAEKVRQDGLDPDDFERGKRKFVGGFIRSFNSLEYISGSFTYYAFHDFDLFQTIDLLSAITREEVEERLRELLDPDARASCVVVPRS